MNQLEHLRWLLGASPSRTRWELLCDLLEGWELEERVKIAIPYAEAHLASWPDALRYAPALWLHAAAEGAQDLPQLRLVRALVRPPTRNDPFQRVFATNAADPGRFWMTQVFTVERFARILQHPELASVRVVDLGYHSEVEATLQLVHARLPALHTVRLWSSALKAEQVAQVVSSPALRGVRCWDLRHVPLSDEAVATWAQAAQAGQRWEELRLEQTSVSAAQLRALLATEAASTLERLDVSGGASDEVIEALSTTRALPALRSLTARQGRFQHRGVRALTQSSHLPALEELDLWSCGPLVKDGALALLLQSPLGERLRALNLSALRADVVAPAMAGAPLERLERLTIRHAALDDHTLMQLVSRREGLRHLDLEANRIGAGAWRVLARQPLRALRANANPVQDLGARAFAASSALEGLVSLDLGYGQIGPEGARALASSRHLGALERLDLTGNLIGPDGFAALLGSTALRALEVLAVGAWSTGGPTLLPLADAAGLPSLRVLSLSAVSELQLDDAVALVRSPLVPRLDWLDLPYTASEEARRCIAQAAIPDRFKDNLRPSSQLWGWTLRDALRVPPSEEALGLIKEYAASLLPGESDPELRVWLQDKLERWWPPALRAKAWTLLRRAGVSKA